MKIQSLVLILLITLFTSCKKDIETVFVDSPSAPLSGDTPVIGDENSTCSDTLIYLGSDLIVNGSFEEGHTLGDNQWGVFNQVGAWYADLSSSDAGIEIQTGQTIGGLAPSDGNSKLEFDAHNKNGFSASDVEVYQTLDTDSAEDYILSFDYSPRVQGNETTNAADVYWDGNLIASLNSEVKGWQTYTLVVRGGGVGTRLSFKGFVDGDTLGGFLDNVKVKQLKADAEGASESVVVRSCLFE